MPDWFCKNLGDALLAGAALDQIKAVYADAYTSTPPPADLAIFVRHESEGRLHCDVMVYFSPAAAGIAQALAAVSCRAPAPDDLGLLAGSEHARAILFPPV